MFRISLDELQMELEEPLPKGDYRFGRKKPESSALPSFPLYQFLSFFALNDAFTTVLE